MTTATSSTDTSLSKHFVTFYSPGTLFMEENCEEVESWDVDAAVVRAQEITQRYGARPHSFRFHTSFRGVDDWQPSVTERSGTYILGGELKHLEELAAENDPENKILLANMRCNGWGRVVINDNSYRSTLIFEDGDVLLDVVFADQSEEAK